MSVDAISLLRRATEGVSGALPRTEVFDYCILAAGTAIAWAYTIELDLLILYTFRRRKGLYFWSLLICSWGCSIHALGFILKFLVGGAWVLSLPFIELGWVWMVTGQAFVLFSRLHLVVRNPQTLRYVLFMIIFNALALHVPTIIFTVGSNSPNASFWEHKFNIMERIQLLGFCIQEFIIATIYIVATVRLLGSIYHSRTRKVMIQLLLINCICIGMDIILICLEFTGNYVSEASIKPLIYSIKLKLEFAVLNQLMGLTKAGFTEDSQFRQPGTNVEMHVPQSVGGTMATAVDPEHGTKPAAGQPKSASTWKNPLAIHSFHHHTDKQDPASTHTDAIFQTKQVDVDVTTAPTSPSNGNVSDTSTILPFSVPRRSLDQHPQLPTYTAQNVPSSGNPAKAASLMGTAIVRMPSIEKNQAAGHHPSRPHPGAARDSSPHSTVDADIPKRHSQDSERDGIRWIHDPDRFR